MGNYSDFETDFVQRTLALIDQYNEMIEVQGKPFMEQYNYTLTLNCLLGLIVLPKERALSFLPADRLTQQLKTSMGLRESQLPGPEMTLRNLILKMRNSVAHFSVQVVSESDEHLVDLIAFRDGPEDENAYATFRAPELLPFLRYYAALLLDNISRRRAQGVAVGDL
ncbi:HEPN family nuclease [Serratia liquefaciens]|uniref:HEPN family nuclease n=1 Tax=Serratia liquefaciens TaxID=614 RepID=UPI003D00B44E